MTPWREAAAHSASPWAWKKWSFRLFSVLVILLSLAVLAWAALGPDTMIGKAVAVLVWGGFVLGAYLRPLWRAKSKRSER